MPPEQVNTPAPVQSEAAKPASFWTRKIVWIPILVLEVLIAFVLTSHFYYLAHPEQFSSNSAPLSPSVSEMSNSSPESDAYYSGLYVLRPTPNTFIPADKKFSILWSVEPRIADSFPSDFTLSVLIYARKQGESGINYPVGDGWLATNGWPSEFNLSNHSEISVGSAGSASWDIPGYIATGQLTPGTYQLVFQLQAQPKDPSRMCAESVGKDCQPNAEDRAIMVRAASIQRETSWFTIVSQQPSASVAAEQKQLVGTWLQDDASSNNHSIAFNSDGTFTESGSGSPAPYISHGSAKGTWSVISLYDFGKEQFYPDSGSGTFEVTSLGLKVPEGAAVIKLQVTNAESSNANYYRLNFVYFSAMLPTGNSPLILDNLVLSPSDAHPTQYVRAGN